MMRMGSQDKSDKRSSKRVKYKGICDDAERRRSIKSIVGQTTESWFNCGIKVKICSTMLLHFQEEWFIIVSLRL